MESNTEINILIIKNILNNIIDDICDKPKILELNKRNKIDKQNKILETECLVCFEPIKKNTDIILFECFHKYHAKCINDWTSFEDNTNQFNTICLLCKTSNFVIIPKRKIVEKKVNYTELHKIKSIDNKIKKETETDDVCSRRCIIC